MCTSKQIRVMKISTSCTPLGYSFQPAPIIKHRLSTRTLQKHIYLQSLLKLYTCQNPRQVSSCSWLFQWPGCCLPVCMLSENGLEVIFPKFSAHSLTLKAWPPWTCFFAFCMQEKMLTALSAAHFLMPSVTLLLITIRSCTSVRLLGDCWEVVLKYTNA